MHVNALSKALIELTEDESIWPGEHQDERLRMAFVQFTSECKKHGVSDSVTRSTGHMVHMEVCTKDYGFCVSTNPHSGNRGQIFSVLLGSSLLKCAVFFSEMYFPCFRSEETNVSTGKGELSYFGAKAFQWSGFLLAILCKACYMIYQIDVSFSILGGDRVSQVAKRCDFGSGCC